MKERTVKFKIRKNRYGHRFVEEPIERLVFREGCKHRVLGCLCEKDYYCFVQADKRKGTIAMLVGCSPNVMCPRLRRWDKKHGLEEPYTMIEGMIKSK